MALLTSCWLCDVLIVLVSAFAAVYFYAQKKFQYWKEKNVPHTNPKFPTGDITGLRENKTFVFVFLDIYKKYAHEKMVGVWMFLKPALLVNDVDLIKHMMIKDFQYFHDRGFEIDTEFEPLAGHLFSMKGQNWRNLRVRLAPTFTSGKMKMMFPTLTQVSAKLNEVIEKSLGQDVDMKDLFVRYTTDVISSCAFGLETSSLDNPESEFRKMAKSINDKGIKERLAGILTLVSPKLPAMLRLRLMPEHITNFFLRIVKEIIDYRDANNVQRKDFLQLLIQLIKQGYVEDPDFANREGGQKQEFSFDEKSAAAQCFLFLFAGFETSSSTMDFAMYELCKRPEIQRKVQKEIDSVMAKHGGQLTFEGIQELQYLEMVISEVLRLYPIASILIRECTKDYPVPDSDVIIEKGTQIMFHVMGIHRNPKYYPDPEKFDPERFTPEAKAEREVCAYIPFGEGPRMCIGNRFALMQVKTGIASVLSNYDVVPCENTPKELVLDDTKDLLMAKGGLLVRLEKRVK